VDDTVAAAHIIAYSGILLLRLRLPLTTGDQASVARCLQILGTIRTIVQAIQSVPHTLNPHAIVSLCWCSRAPMI
jgi:hypothetical protein